QPDRPEVLLENVLLNVMLRLNSDPSMSQPKCRFCAATLSHTMCDLGLSPLANSYVKFESVNLGERFFPLKVWVCEKCLLCQLEDFESPDAIFSDYPYFSSFSTSWVEHARRYCEMMIARFG